jgi:hypothetical protein
MTIKAVMERAADIKKARMASAYHGFAVTKSRMTGYSLSKDAS